MPIRLEGITLYTVKDIEDLLGVGNSTVRRYISEGRLRGRKMARRWYIPAENLLAYFHESKQEPPVELVEKLKALEARLDEKDKRGPRQKISLARIAKGSRSAPAVPRKTTPPATAAAPTHGRSTPEPDTDVARLLEQARRLKKEAARLEQLYVTDHDQDS